MSRRRLFASSTAAVTLAVSVVLVATSQPAAAAARPWCDSGAAPCIASVTVDGAAVTSANTDWGLSLFESTASGSHDLLWNALNKASGGSPYDLGTGGLEWTIVLDTGSVIPRVAHQFGDSVTVTRSQPTPGDYHVTIVARPTKLLDNSDCNVSSWPWTCPYTAGSMWSGYLGGTITDYDEWADTAQRSAMYGMNYTTNVEETSIPPEIQNDPATGESQLYIRLANSHQDPSQNVFHGFVHLRIPTAFLRTAYGIDDPASLTNAGLTSTGAGTSATTVITQEPSDAMDVDITGITFSSHLVKIRRGLVTPTRPTSVAAKRTALHRGKLTFTKSRPRGSKITGYKARCVAASGHHIVYGTASASPVVVTELRKGVAYDCRIQAKSKAGLGTRSVSVRIPRHT